MAWLQNGTPGGNLGNDTTAITVPSGVLPSHFCLFTLSGSSASASIVSSAATSTNDSAIITTIIDTADVKNSFLSVFYATGLTAGDTITVTTGGNTNGRLSHFYFDTAMVTWGSLGTRGGVNQTTVIAPSATVAPGSQVYLYEMSRVTTTDSLSSTTNANGRTLNSLYSNYTTTSPSVNVNLWQFTEPTASTGTSTITESASSTNAAAFYFAEALPAASAWFTA